MGYQANGLELGVRYSPLVRCIIHAYILFKSDTKSIRKMIDRKKAKRQKQVVSYETWSLWNKLQHYGTDRLHIKCNTM